MFARIKKSRHEEYLQIVENYRDGDRVRQRLVLYVGHYESVQEALRVMPKDWARARRRATEDEQVAESVPRYQPRARALREEADRLAERLEALRRLVEAHPDLLNRDRERAERHAQRQRLAMAKRWEALRASSRISRP